MLQLLEQLDPECARPDCLRYRGRILADRAELRSLQARLAERDADLATLDALATTSDDDHLRLQTSLQRARYLNLDAQYEQAIAKAKEGLALADILKDTSARCYLLTQIGFAYYFLGQPQPALTALESALAMTPETDRETRRHITHILGYTHFHLGDYARALSYYRESYADHKTAGDYNGMVWAGLDIGATYREMGHLTTAEQHLTEHLNLARRIGARSAEAYGLIQLGSWELGQGNYATAADLFRQALSTQQGLRTEHGRVAAETGTGYALYHLGDLPEARRWLEQAVQRARPIRHQRRLMEALIGLGLVEIAASRPLVAHGFLSEAVVVARDAECKGNLVAGLAALAHAERQLGNRTQALAHASEAVRISQDLVAPVYEMWGELEMGLAWLAQGNPEIALEHTERAVNLIPKSDESWIGTEQVHRAHAQVLRALGRMLQAEEQERMAVGIIETKAKRISDPGQRQDYLQAVMCAP
jgi:tetratricopeptide (TPR) repeat protein